MIHPGAGPLAPCREPSEVGPHRVTMRSVSSALSRTLRPVARQVRRVAAAGGIRGGAAPPTPPAAVPVRPGAESYAAGNGTTGVLLCHGYTSSPWSLRGWADHLAAHGFRVAVPRLPGHGTVWTELNRTDWSDWYAVVEREFDRLRRDCDRVFVGALSMGAGLALRLAALRGSEVGGLVLVNPFINSTDPRLLTLPVLRRVVASLGGVANDTAKPGQDERAYDRLPLDGLAAVTRLWADLRPRLRDVRQPVLVFRSVVDHVIDQSSVKIIAAEVGSAECEVVALERSYHVATMDYDAQVIFDGSVALFRRLSAN